MSEINHVRRITDPMYDVCCDSTLSPGDELPAGLKIKGRVPHVLKVSGYDSWIITDGTPDDGNSGKQGRLVGTGEWKEKGKVLTSELCSWPTRTAAIEAACQHADLPPGASMVIEGGHWMLQGMPSATLFHRTAREAYLAAWAAAKRERTKCQECGAVVARAEAAERERDNLSDRLDAIRKTTDATDFASRLNQLNEVRQLLHCELPLSKAEKQYEADQARIATLEAALSAVQARMKLVARWDSEDIALSKQIDAALQKGNP